MFCHMIRSLFILLCSLPVSVLATESRSIHVEWGYTPPSEPAVTGFKLYQEGTSACQVKNAIATSMDCVVTLVKDATNFTLTAMFANGTESPHSAPFSFSLAGEPAPLSTITDLFSLVTAPTALISTGTAVGTCPLTVTFDGSESTSGSSQALVGYQWDFGDGNGATDAQVSHVYEEAGAYTATLTVTDAYGRTSSIAAPVVVAEAVQSPQGAAAQTSSEATSTAGSTASLLSLFVPIIPLHLEVGDIQVTSEWGRVTFAESYSQPIVIAGPPQTVDAAPCTVRIRNVTSSGFDICLVQWPYQTGVHGGEKVSYLVLEKGRSQLEDGSVVEAGTFSGTTQWQDVSWLAAHTTTPVVLTSVTSSNDSKAVVGRVIPSTSGFAFRLQGQELSGGSHAAETVHYVAWTPGQGVQDAFCFEAVAGAFSLTEAWKTQEMQNRFLQSPFIFAEMQSRVNLDTAALRLDNVTRSAFQAKIEEEQSWDSEQAHAAEQISYLAIAPTGPARLVTFSWEFDHSQETPILGFRILANGEELCITHDPGARFLGCTMIAPMEPVDFSIVALFGDNEASEGSVPLTYTP